MKALFFDSTATLLAKNLLPIANSIKLKEDNFSAIFISAEIASNIDDEVEKESIDKILNSGDNIFLTFKSFNVSEIFNFLNKNNPDILFIDCYRIIDQLWVGVANKLNIKTYYLQHGFEIDTVYYKPFSIITKFKKGLRLVGAVFNLSKLLEASFINLFIQYYKYIYYGQSLRNSFLSDEALHPLKIFVYSEYYKSFWSNKFNFHYDKMVTITAPDFLLINNIKSLKSENALCYITQTLVEDGRMKKHDFLKLMEEYKTIANNVSKLIIKLHPRSEISLYNTFLELKNVKIQREFPHATEYITHYSSMAFLASYISNTVILHEIEGHPTPLIFKKLPSIIIKNSNEIMGIIKSKSKICEVNNNLKELNYYAFFEKQNPYEKIYSIISDT